MLAMQSVPPIAIGLVIALVGGGVCAVLMSFLRKRRRRVSTSDTTAIAREEMLQADSLIDQKMDELNDARDQSLRGMKLDVRAELLKPQKPKPASFLDAKAEELREITEATPKKVYPSP
jgi:hypothetical protein